jgi:uncharacterized protein (DUF2141 family)
MTIIQKRKLLRSLFAVGIVVARGTMAAAPAQTPAMALVSISGSVAGGSGNHAIFVAMWDSTGFLKHPAQEIRIPPHAEPHFQFQAPPGRWALSAYEDNNDNGKLDMGMFGPKEPAGFWHPFHAWRKPRFDDVAVQVDHDTTDANITLK